MIISPLKKSPKKAKNYLEAGINSTYICPPQRYKSSLKTGKSRDLK